MRVVPGPGRGDSRGNGVLDGLWRALVGLTFVAGLAASLVVFGWSGLPVCAVVVGLLSLCGVLVVKAEDFWAEGGIRLTVQTSLLAIAGIGLVSLLALPGMLWIVMLGLTAPRFRPRLWGWLPRSAPTESLDAGAETSVAEPTPGADLPPLDELDDRALCQAWRQTYVTLRHTASASARHRVVRRRQDLLDELERRHPTAMAGWLASDPRAAGDPLRYLGSSRNDDDGGRRAGPDLPPG